MHWNEIVDVVYISLIEVTRSSQYKYEEELSFIQMVKESSE